MSARTDVLLWAQRVAARKDAPAHQILEIAANAALEAAQEAFHKIARIAHPDLHRTTLTPDELELVTTAYARAAAAYQDLRSQRLSTGRMRLIPPPDPAAADQGGRANRRFADQPRPGDDAQGTAPLPQGRARAPAR
jgi:hypothetical protein